MGISLTPEEQLEIFGTDQIPEWQREAKDRWGDTEAWRESQRRTAAYTKEDWIEITREAADNQAAFVQIMRSGAPADGEQAMDLAEAHRRHICSWFYECDHRMHGNLAEMYVADPRFRASYERQAIGLAAFVHDAILANLRRHGG